MEIAMWIIGSLAVIVGLYRGFKKRPLKLKPREPGVVGGINFVAAAIAVLIAYVFGRSQSG